MAILWPRDVYAPAEEPKAGVVISIILSLVTMAVISVCLSRRVQNICNWSRLPLICWLIILIYSDSIVFVLCTAVLSYGFGVNSSLEICSGAILLCLICYLSTKLIYYFLVEKAYIIRRTTKPRLKDRLYLFNCFGMLVPYVAVATLNFVFRIARIDDGVCYIGMKKVAMIPLIGFEVLVNVYLTTLFLIPLRRLYSYKNNPTSLARTVVLRTFIGSLCTLTSSITNITVVMVLNGEPGWICLMCCNCDIFFSVLVLQWVTSKDNASTVAFSSYHSQDTKTTSSRAHPLRDHPHFSLSPTQTYELGLRDHIGNAHITTLVTARNRDSIEEDEQQHDLQMPKMAITVQKEVDVEERLHSAGLGIGRGQMRIGSQDSLVYQ